MKKIFYLLLICSQLHADAPISSEQAKGIYAHLITYHEIPKTGLFLSFVGTGDRKLTQQSSTYEQAVMGLLALHVGDTKRADRLLQFFYETWFTPRIEGGEGFANFYNAYWKTEGIEKTIHTGPNAWVGLFAARLANRYPPNPQATQLSLSIFEWIKTLPRTLGGVSMGPKDDYKGPPWTRVYSVENNLSVYAFLDELLKNPNLSEVNRRSIQTERDQIFKWLTQVGYDASERTMNRGVNPDGIDHTRALDTLTWSIASIGPVRLRQANINPDRLMDQIERDFSVRTKGNAGLDPTNLSGAKRAATQKAFGSDQKPSRDETLNDRLIWYEGLGQYLIALQVMIENTTDPKRKMLYQNQLMQRTRELDAASLKTYPAGTAFAYSTPGKLFHDGWWSPTGNENGEASSLVSGAWRLFGGLGINPLTGKATTKTISRTSALALVPSKEKQTPTLFFGTSGDMATHAWDALNSGDTAKAKQQAEATIEEWASFAKTLQSDKQKDVGNLIRYSGLSDERAQIFSYWALNDVGAAYYILAKLYDQASYTTQAAKALEQIQKNYSLAQVWDPKGWFWAPAQALQKEFVLKNPEAYGHLAPAIESFSEGKKPF